MFYNQNIVFVKNGYFAMFEKDVRNNCNLTSKTIIITLPQNYCIINLLFS